MSFLDKVISIIMTRQVLGTLLVIIMVLVLTKGFNRIISKILVKGKNAILKL